MPRFIFQHQKEEWINITDVKTIRYLCHFAMHIDKSLYINIHWIFMTYCKILFYIRSPYFHFRSVIVANNLYLRKWFKYRADAKQNDGQQNCWYNPSQLCLAVDLYLNHATWHWCRRRNAFEKRSYYIRNALKTKKNESVIKENSMRIWIKSEWTQYCS